MDTRPATEQDIPFLLSLRRETMTAHLLASGADASESHHRERVMHRFDCARILLDRGRPAGLLKVDRAPGEWEIVQIQLAPELQGAGTGRRILEEIVEQAAQAGAGVRLSVLKANPARHLYARLGFEVVGETAHEYLMARAA